MFIAGAAADPVAPTEIHRLAEVALLEPFPNLAEGRVVPVVETAP
jgi:hypothetical protein